MLEGSGGMPLQEIFENQTAKVRFWWHLRDRVTNARGVWGHAPPGDF